MPIALHDQLELQRRDEALGHGVAHRRTTDGEIESARANSGIVSQLLPGDPGKLLLLELCREDAATI